MGDFNTAVYEIVAKIPKGKVATYGQIAAMLGKPIAARAVGQAMKNAPEYLNLPCHRVVNKSGAMAPGYAFGGEPIQRNLLESEGVLFKSDGCIDMKRYIWKTSNL